MNITKLVASLQKAANTSTTSAELANLSRAIKGLNVGTVQTVANTAGLPAMLPTNGNLYYVESEEDLYYNIGGTWNRFYTDLNIVYNWGSIVTAVTSSPVTVAGGITNWKQISGGGSTGSVHRLGVTLTGIAYAWGENQNGQLGDNTTIAKTSSPVTVVGDITNWNQVSVGSRHSLGLTSAGVAYAWGRNYYGQLGINTNVDRSSPVTVVGGIANWSQLSAGEQHSLGLTTTGIAYAWGRGDSAQLGDNTTSSRSSPVTVVGGITTWRQLSSGRMHNLALTTAGIAYAWGNSYYGQLGQGNLSPRSSPVTVVGGITNWNNLTAGRDHSLGIRSTGILYSWGRNVYGQLGDNTSGIGASKLSPVTVVGGITNWSQVSGGGQHSLGLTAAGIAYGWGNNDNGQLGDSTITVRSSPVTVVGGFTSWSQISAGGIQSLGIVSSLV